MSKFSGLLGKGKGFAKNLGMAAYPIALGTGGVIASAKFLDFKTVFPNMKPDDFFIKHEGLIKVGAVVITLAMWQKCPSWLKYLLIGVAIQGGLKAVKQYTMNDQGKAFFDQIADKPDYSDEISAAAEKMLNFAANTSNTGVGKVHDAKKGADTSRALEVYSNTGVAGMGVENDFNWAA